MLYQQLFTNIGGYTGKIEKVFGSNPTSLCRVDKYTEPRRFQQAVRFFKRKYNSKDSITTDMWLGSQVRVTSVQLDDKHQILRLEVSKA